MASWSCDEFDVPDQGGELGRVAGQGREDWPPGVRPGLQTSRGSTDSHAVEPERSSAGLNGPGVPTCIGRFSLPCLVKGVGETVGVGGGGSVDPIELRL